LFSQEDQETITRILNQVREPILNKFPTIPKSSSAKAQITKQSRELLNELHQRLWEIREGTPRRFSQIVKPTKGGRSLVIVLSDSHFGEKIEATEINGEYNIQIATERLLDIPDLLQQSDIINLQIDEVLVLMVGDHVDGEGIFNNQYMEIETHATEQILRCTTAHWCLFKKLRERFDCPIRVVTIRGNHGRSGLSDETNWDNIIFLQLELLIDMEDHEWITIQNRYGEVNPFVVQGWKGLIRHIAPVQADTAAGKTKYGGWEAIHDWDLLATGHWHHWGVLTYMGKPIFRNGSMVGPNNFSEKLATVDDPVQLAFTVTEEDLPEIIIPLRW